MKNIQFSTCSATLPNTRSCEMASVVPHSFLIFILISPDILRWHFVSTRRVCEEDFSILVWVSSNSSSPSLYHWIFMGSRPMKDSSKAAPFPVLITTGFLNSSRSSDLILGGSSEKAHSFFKLRLLLLSCEEKCFTHILTVAALLFSFSWSTST